MSIPPRFLDDIRNRLTLSDVIGQKIRVVRAGREYKACCPFHNEKTPSFTINNDKQFYHCFGCGAHGDVIGFTMRYSNLSFMDAVESLAAEAGLQMPTPDPAFIEKSRKENDLYMLMQKASDWFMAQLENVSNTDVLAYLDQRGLGPEARAMFRIGYAPADGQAIRIYLHSQGFSDAQMLEAALIKNSSKGGEPYAFFRDRVMFPVCDRRGRVVAFGGRILPAHMRPVMQGDFQPPKYINSSDTPLFDKGHMLYGENFVRQNAREGHTVLVTEGYMDVIACHMAGFKGAVAPMGTALTEEQILLLWAMNPEGSKTPILCFDGDNAGRRAASRAVERILPLLGPDKTVKLAFLPEGEDPDSLIKSKGRTGFQEILTVALSLFDFLWVSHTAGRHYDTPEARAGLQKSLQQDISLIKSYEIQRHYKELVRERIHETFFKPYNVGSAARSGPDRSASRPSALKLRTPQKSPDYVGERALLATILNNPELYPQIEEDFGRFTIQNARLFLLRQKMVEVLQVSGEVDAQSLHSILLQEGFVKEMDDIQNESVYVHATFSRHGSLAALGESEVLRCWKITKQGLAQALQEKEIKQKWQEAFDNTNTEAEENLRQLVQVKKFEDEHL